MNNLMLDEFRSMVKSFLEEEIIKKTNGLVPTRELILDVWRKAGKKGVFRSSIAEEYNGLANKNYSLILLEELGKHLMLDYPFWLQADVISHLVNRYGTESQKERMLKDISSGEKIGALALTEKQGGSNFAKFECKVNKESNYYVLNGQKCFISNCTIADFYLVAANYVNNGANYLSLFIVDSKQEGVSVKGIKNEVAMKCLDFGEVTFNNVRIYENQILGQQPKDTRMGLMSALTIERFACSVISYHMCEVLLEYILKWSQSREIEGGSLVDNQYIKYQIGQQYADNCILKQYILEIKKKYIQGKKLSVSEIAIAKYKIINQLINLSDFAIKLYGARSFSTSFTNIDLVKIHNDALAQSIAGGTSEIMLKIISDSLIKNRSYSFA
ncbi:acyl-CoA/acyl-ACP dehydrogenase (plasmid) [Bacillus cereus]|uniref:Acyl-[acyl-carrier-protein] dehydrogenase MbtN n=1 Tax=Bacillus cereus TaxID=1396 RepID=A0AB73UU29_BACCE|nr:acyl-CoA dehydrogenase family protein [Bacillus cereus]HDR3523483.1 acyl-CoA/acyl-ACP dehydrogenase [Bacillus pacificus]QHV07976.1 hypothetical protein C1N82_32790 [Bacillus cereus]QHV47436.1 acyl-CoA/acyl-ACP dehydrogenase [Bacillus cereus]HDR3634040.1 acyl-CoA/acyl-ACP dehydrogenase [Bacillus pacificus]HDR7652976.1 acyl-CoA/acyl-ACP dehydrogenase [Bacillus pacificus]